MVANHIGTSCFLFVVAFFFFLLSFQYVKIVAASVETEMRAQFVQEAFQIWISVCFPYLLYPLLPHKRSPERFQLWTCSLHGDLRLLYSFNMRQTGAMFRAVRPGMSANLS